MPGHHPSMPGWFAEQLVVPEPDGAIKDLGCRNRECRVPEAVMETRGYPPGSQGVEQYAGWVFGFVGVVLVEEVIARVAGVQKASEFLEQLVSLIRFKNLDATDKAVFVESGHLVRGEPKSAEISGVLPAIEEGTRKAMNRAQILHQSHLSLAPPRNGWKTAWPSRFPKPHYRQITTKSPQAHDWFQRKKTLA